MSSILSSQNKRATASIDTSQGPLSQKAIRRVYGTGSMSATNASSIGNNSSNPRARMILQAKSSHSVQRDSQSPATSADKRLKLVIKSQQNSNTNPKSDMKLNLNVLRD